MDEQNRKPNSEEMPEESQPESSRADDDAMKTIIDDSSTTTTDDVSNDMFKTVVDDAPDAADSEPETATSDDEPLETISAATQSSSDSSPAPTQPSADKSEAFDPHATQFTEMDTESSSATRPAVSDDEKQRFDPHATQFTEMEEKSDSTPPADAFTTMPPTSDIGESTPPAGSTQPSSPAGQGLPTSSYQAPTQQKPPEDRDARMTGQQQATGSPFGSTGSSDSSSSSGPSFPGMGNFTIGGSSMVKDLGRVPLVLLWSGIVLVSGVGLALFMRFFLLTFIYFDFSILRILLGIIGAGLAVGPWFALSFLPQLNGAQQRLDQLEDPAGQLRQQVNEPMAPRGLWLFLLAGVIVLATLLGSMLGTEAKPIVNVDGDGSVADNFRENVDELYSENFYRDIPPVEDGSNEIGDATIDINKRTRPVLLVLGLLGAVAIVGSAVYSDSDDNLAPNRKFEPLQLIRPLAAGGGLLAVMMSLALISHISGNFVYFVLLAIVGMFGIAGMSLRILPASFLEIFTRWKVAIFVALSSISLMSLVTMFADMGTVGNENTIEETYRFAYSPAYFIYTVADRNLPLISLMSIPLVAFGVGGAVIALQAFGYGIVEDRAKGMRYAGLLVAVALPVMLLTLILYPLLSLIGLSYAAQGWFLAGITFLLVIGLVRQAQLNPQFIGGLLSRYRGLIGQLPQGVPPQIRTPLQQAGNTRATDINQMLTWQFGLALAVLMALLAVPLAVSFWFWLLAFVGVLFLLGNSDAPTSTGM